MGHEKRWCAIADIGIYVPSMTSAKIDSNKSTKVTLERCTLKMQPAEGWDFSLVSFVEGSNNLHTMS